MLNKKNKTKGFTIVELIVVLAILGILMAIAIPMYGKYLNKGKNATASVTANAINNAVVRTLFAENGNPTFEISSTSNTEYYNEVTGLSKLSEGETLEFKYYNAETKSDLPTADNFTQKENVWVVYLPQNPTDNTFAFDKYAYIYTPSAYDLQIYANGVLVE